ncbi:MAG: hypothetical protein ABJH68_07040 [Ilumatobacter sp.]|uniref:hypothetical protein n=1 Tax=Ilumatobacter sp. TaxID=1967498 RepID=UPI00329826E6
MTVGHDVDATSGRGIPVWRDTVADLGDELFGENRLACQRDGSVNFVRRPVREVEIFPDFTQLEPVDDVPVELVLVDPSGTISVQATGDLRLL